MFGHLKAEDFIDRIDGDELPADLRTHLQSCRECAESLASAQSFHSAMTQAAASEDDIPEPDWSQFRMDVRNSMLSRAAQRQPKTGWAGWLLRPAMSWGLAIAFTAGLGAGVLIWNQHGSNPPAPSQIASGETRTLQPAVKPDNSTPVEQVAELTVRDSSVTSSNVTADVATEPVVFDAGPATWSQTSVFEQLSQLSDAQAEKLQRLLEADARQVPHQQ